MKPRRAQPEVPAGDLGRRVLREERLLLASVGAWGLLSVVAGAALWLVGRRGRAGDPAGDRTGPGELAVGIGRQAVVWGAVDLAVVGFGARRTAAAPANDPDAARRARRMAAITGGNALADVGYLATAGWLLRTPRRRPDAVGALAQAAFLLVVDARHAVRFARHWRSGRTVATATTRQRATSQPSRP